MRARKVRLLEGLAAAMNDIGRGAAKSFEDMASAMDVMGCQMKRVTPRRTGTLKSGFRLPEMAEQMLEKYGGHLQFGGGPGKTVMRGVGHVDATQFEAAYGLKDWEVGRGCRAAILHGQVLHGQAECHEFDLVGDPLLRLDMEVEMVCASGRAA